MLRTAAATGLSPPVSSRGLVPGSPDLTGAGPGGAPALSYGTAGRSDLALWEDVAAGE